MKLDWESTKILDLLSLIGGKHDLAFLDSAFQDVEKGDIAVAVIELCQEGKLSIDQRGIYLPLFDGPGGDGLEKEEGTSECVESCSSEGARKEGDCAECVAVNIPEPPAPA